MKKAMITMASILGILIILIIVMISIGSTTGNGFLTAGDYIYGKDIAAKSYMYQLGGPGEVIIKSANEEEVYYKYLKEGESIHEHYLPLEEGSL